MAKVLPNKKGKGYIKLNNVNDSLEGSTSRERLKRAFKEDMAKGGYKSRQEKSMESLRDVDWKRVGGTMQQPQLVGTRKQSVRNAEQNKSVRQQQMHEMRDTSPQIVNRIDSQKKNTNRVMVNINKKNKRKV